MIRNRQACWAGGETKNFDRMNRINRIKRKRLEPMKDRRAEKVDLDHNIL